MRRPPAPSNAGRGQPGVAQPLRDQPVWALYARNQVSNVGGAEALPRCATNRPVSGEPVAPDRASPR